MEWFPSTARSDAVAAPLSLPRRSRAKSGSRRIGQNAATERRGHRLVQIAPAMVEDAHAIADGID
jgi:hypothetical protein